jgi:hypothetical protein
MVAIASKNHTVYFHCIIMNYDIFIKKMTCKIVVHSLNL